MTVNRAPLVSQPPALRANPLCSRGAKVLVLAAALVGGSFAGAAVPGNAAPTRPAVCLPPLICVTVSTPTVTTPTLPTISSAVSTGSASTSTAAPTTSQTTTSASAGDQAQAPSSTLAFTLSISMHRRLHRRWIALRLMLSQPATVGARLVRNRTLISEGRYTARTGENLLRLSVPSRAKAGGAQLTLDLTAGATRRQVVRSIVLPGR